MKLKIFLIILLSLIFNLKSPTAFAQSIDLSIAPPIFQAQINPPANTKVPFVVRNLTDNTVPLKISLKPFTAAPDETGKIEFIENPTFEDPFIVDRIVVSENDVPVDFVTLSPQEIKELALEFRIPSNEPKGEYYFSLIFSTLPQSGLDSNLTQATAAISSNILLSVGPLGKKQGLIEEFNAPVVVSKGPIPFNVRLKNTSDHFVTVKGDILLTNMFGQAVGKVKLLPVNVLANSTRRIPDSIQSGVNEKEYEKIKNLVEKSSSPIAIWPEKFLLGPYKATLNISLSDQGPVYTRTIRFFAFPLEYLLGILILIAVVVFVVLRVKRKLSINP